MRLILADDAMLFREGMARLLIEAGFDVAGQARDATGLFALVSREPPDVAIIDIRMPWARACPHPSASLTSDRRPSPAAVCPASSAPVAVNGLARRTRPAVWRPLPATGAREVPWVLAA